jgi:hypothetical protein
MNITIDNLPSSVSKYNYLQLATCYRNIFLDTNISKVVIPDNVNKLKKDIKNTLYWKIDEKYSFLPDIGDTNKSMCKIMMYVNETTYNTPNNNTIEKLEKLIFKYKQDLENDILKLNETEILTRKQTIETHNKYLQKCYDDEKRKLSPNHIANIVKRVQEILNDYDRAPKLFREFEYLSRPVVDHLKEGSGGDYVLQNSLRDRRYKQEVQKTVLDVQKQDLKVQKSDLEVQKPVSDVKKTKYVPPKAEDEDIVKKNKYIAPKVLESEPTDENLEENDNNTFIKLTDIKSSVDIMSSIDFPDLCGTNNITYNKKEKEEDYENFSWTNEKLKSNLDSGTIKTFVDIVKTKVPEIKKEVVNKKIEYNKEEEEDNYYDEDEEYFVEYDEDEDEYEYDDDYNN